MVLKTSSLRTLFLDFFKGKKHDLFSSDTLVPDDASVFFTSAGMNQFKPYFLGEKEGTNKAVSCQKCLRTGDLERVGKTDYHHTFFEMLGNFSFGDYFKEGAITLAWEFLTKQLNLKKEDLWVSVYSKDKEAYTIWKENIGISDHQIIKLGESNNFWPADAPSLGPNGPCGPCSEIFFDRGANKGCLNKTCNPDCDCGRFVEIWNLVFTQYDRVGDNKLEPLPQKNIDTGMGLERMAAVLQGKNSNFQIDILQPIVQNVREHLNANENNSQANSLINSIVDHIRAATFAIGDGVYPSNEERGYVVRKLIRKASWSASLVGNQKVFLYKLPFLFSELMSDFYSELRQKKEIISKVIKAEEERFCSTLNIGKEHLLTEIKKLRAKNKNSVGAEELFRFYDTYGFPVELSKEIANQHGLSVDRSGFKKLILQQQERSRKKSMFDNCIFKKGDVEIRENSQFCGYEVKETKAKITRIFSSYDQLLAGSETNALGCGEEGFIILDKTPFYPESGGQLADKGLICVEEGGFVVDRVFKVNQAIIHKGKVSRASILKGQQAVASIDQDRRGALARAHTVTHLLQAALRSVLGEHVCQQGSLVDEDKLRFDFTHFQSLSRKELDSIESLVNSFIFQGDEVSKRFISLEEAKAEGALAFFKDKYGESVRSVTISNYSKELCAGTHLSNTFQAGEFVIISEASISSGIRRIEALTGKKAHYYLKDFQNTVIELSSLFKCEFTQVNNSAHRILKEIKGCQQKMSGLLKERIAILAKDVALKCKKNIEGVAFLFYTWDDADSFLAEDPSLVKSFIDFLHEEMSGGFVFVVYNHSGKNNFIFSACDEVVKEGFDCKVFIEILKESVSLRGGGRKTCIQGVTLNIPVDFEEIVIRCFSKFAKQLKR